MKVVGYIRVSTDKQAEEGISVEAQEAKLRAYADAVDLDLVDIKVDAGYSAKDLVRPGVQQALQMIKCGQVEGLLVVKLDRLSRSTVDTANLVTTHFQDAALISIAEKIDTSSATGRVFLKMCTLFSEWEREIIAERTQDALTHLRNQGVQLGASALGWDHGTEEQVDRDGRRCILPNQDEARTVRRILQLSDEGCSLRMIADQLVDEGHPTKRGGRWQANTVRKVLVRARAARGLQA